MKQWDLIIQYCYCSYKVFDIEGTSNNTGLSPGTLGTRGKPLVAFYKPNLPRPGNQAMHLFSYFISKF